MPVDVMIDGEHHRLDARSGWRNVPLEARPANVVIDHDFYVAGFDVIGS